MAPRNRSLGDSDPDYDYSQDLEYYSPDQDQDQDQDSDNDNDNNNDYQDHTRPIFSPINANRVQDKVGKFLAQISTLQDYASRLERQNTLQSLQMLLLSIGLRVRDGMVSTELDSHLAEAMSIAQELGDEVWMARCRYWTGRVELARGNEKNAYEHFVHASHWLTDEYNELEELKACMELCSGERKSHGRGKEQGQGEDEEEDDDDDEEENEDEHGYYRYGGYGGGARIRPISMAVTGLLGDELGELGLEDEFGFGGGMGYDGACDEPQEHHHQHQQQEEEEEEEEEERDSEEEHPPQPVFIPILMPMPMPLPIPIPILLNPPTSTSTSPSPPPKQLKSPPPAPPPNVLGDIAIFTGNKPLPGEKHPLSQKKIWVLPLHPSAVPHYPSSTSTSTSTSTHPRVPSNLDVSISTPWMPGQVRPSLMPMNFKFWKYPVELAPRWRPCNIFKEQIYEGLYPADLWKRMGETVTGCRVTMNCLDKEREQIGRKLDGKIAEGYGRLTTLEENAKVESWGTRVLRFFGLA